MNHEDELNGGGSVKKIVVEDDIELKIAQAQTTNGLVTETTDKKGPRALRPAERMQAKIGAPIADDFWLDDPFMLLRADRLTEFFPSPNHNTNEQLNALTRFFIYLGVLVAFYRKSPKPFFYVAAIPVACIAYYFLKESSGLDHNEHESFDGPSARRFQKPAERMHPTASNPYMNPDPTMYGTRQYLIPPADVNDPLVRKEIQDAFAEGNGEDMFTDETDIWERKQEQLMFHTVPRYIDFGEFQDYLYPLPPETCKENTAHCPPPYQSHRANKVVYGDPTQNPTVG